jgi:hypothetical protein
MTKLRIKVSYITRDACLDRTYKRYRDDSRCKGVSAWQKGVKSYNSDHVVSNLAVVTKLRI